MVMKASPSEVFDGVLLSDAHIASNYGSPYFKIAQAGEERVGWLASIEEALVSLGVETSGIKITNRVNNFTKRPYRCCELVSRAHPIIKAGRALWYPDGKKKVPRTLELTPGTLAHWFMGDGASTRLKNREYYVKASLCTQCYPDEDVAYLADLLLGDLNIRATCNRVSKVNGRGLVLNISAVEEVNRLMDLVEPYMLPSYAYKVKRAFFSMAEMKRLVPW